MPGAAGYIACSSSATPGWLPVRRRQRCDAAAQRRSARRGSALQDATQLKVGKARSRMPSGGQRTVHISLVLPSPCGVQSRVPRVRAPTMDHSRRATSHHRPSHAARVSRGFLAERIVARDVWSRDAFSQRWIGSDGSWGPLRFIVRSKRSIRVTV